MNFALVLACTLAIGLAAPPLLARARWTRRTPTLAVLLWQALAATFVLCLVLMVHHLVTPAVTAPDSVLHICGWLLHGHASAHGSTSGPVAVTVPTALAAWPIGWTAIGIARSALARRRHADSLALVSHPAPGLDALLIDHPVPAVYCLPGRNPRVVVTRGATETLTDAQLHAVLAHERAHIRGRHHLALCFADGLARAFPGLPLARHLRTEVSVLLEMAADDHALLHHDRADLATAMYQVAAARTPTATLGAGGHSCLLRIQRLAEPQPRPHLLVRAGLAVLAIGAPVITLSLACLPSAG